MWHFLCQKWGSNYWNDLEKNFDQSKEKMEMILNSEDPDVGVINKENPEREQFGMEWYEKSIS